jgi:hypothetical protein
VRDIVRRSGPDQYRLAPLIMNIVASVPFRQRAATGPGVPATGNTVAATAREPLREPQP